jgi:hypothetical protein
MHSTNGGTMNATLKLRATIETALAALAAGLFLLTMVTREWIEALTGWDPDHGNGMAELAIIAALIVLCASFSLRARSDWRKARALPA